MSFPERKKPAEQGKSASRLSHLVFSLFCIGLVFGAVLGCAADSSAMEDFLEPYLDRGLSERFFSSVWNSFVFILFALFCGTSFLGIIFIPASAFLKAYSMGFSVAALMGGGMHGFLSAFFAVGLPSLILIPCFLVCAVDGIGSSAALLGLRFSVGWKGIFPRIPLSHYLFIILGALLAAAYDLFLLPSILVNIT